MATPQSNLMDMFSRFSSTGSMPSDMFNFNGGGASSTIRSGVENVGTFNSSTGAAPGVPAGTPPGAVPPANSGAPYPIATNYDYQHGHPQSQYPIGSKTDLGGNNTAVPTLDPGFTGQFYSWLQSQLGGGATPFNMATPLPGGGSTQAGQLNAPLSDINSMLQNFYKSGTGGPAGSGLDTLQSEAHGGQAFNVSPEWQAMVAAQQKNIQQNQAQLKEQFAGSGALGGTEYGTAMSNFMDQTTKDQNSLLAQLTQSSYENAQQRQMQASGELASGATAMGSQIQGLNQDAINRLQAEFIRTRPEYSPLLNQMFAGATTFPSVIGKSVGVGTLGAALSGSGTALSGVADLWKTIHDGSSGGN